MTTCGREADGRAQRAARCPPQNEFRRRVSYTGGTTWISKAAILLHRQVMAQAIQATDFIVAAADGPLDEAGDTAGDKFGGVWHAVRVVRALTPRSR
jgi:acyl-CoA synthetase (AMP-forming)/AMP-acid ligase II